MSRAKMIPILRTDASSKKNPVRGSLRQLPQVTKGTRKHKDLSLGKLEMAFLSTLL